jgi:cytochrome c oxidase subunit III
MAQAVENIHADHGHHPPYLQHHFTTVEQQFDAAKLGMWVFLATEILMFGGLFVAYAVFFSLYPEAFNAGHHALNVPLGIVNTTVLIFSSLTMALGVNAAQRGNQRRLIVCVAITIACALTFMVIKYFEYSHKIHEGTLPGWFFTNTEPIYQVPHIGTYFALYFMMTGLHGIHVTVGIGIMVWLLVKAIKGHFSAEWYTPVEMTGLYWHLVDLVWIYLFPLLYLVK